MIQIIPYDGKKLKRCSQSQFVNQELNCPKQSTMNIVFGNVDFGSIIKDMSDFENHVNYIHYNPIKHGLVKDLHDWPHSSFHHYVHSGQIEKHWAGSGAISVDGLCFGE